MDLARARYLTSPAGLAALKAVPEAVAAMPLVQQASALRRELGGEGGAAIGEQLALRARARDRFGADLGFLYSAEGLEMMTHPRVATRRAERLAALGLPIADLTAGLGGDLHALASRAQLTVGVERDHSTVLLAAANVPSAHVVRGDALHPPVDIGRFAVVVDPSRRSGQRRQFSPADFSPPWDAALSLLRAARAGVLKSSPGVDHALLPAESEVEFVQLGRSLRETAVWFGGDARPGVRRAVLLPQQATIDSTEPEATGAVHEPRRYLFDPESAVTRAGLVRQLAFRLRAGLMDPMVAYLTAEEPAFDALAATFGVLAVVPFSVGRLKAELRRRSWQADEIRRRAFPVEPDDLRRQLGRLDGERVTLLCTTILGRRLVFIARRLLPPGDEVTA